MPEVDPTVANAHAERILIPDAVEYPFHGHKIQMKPIPIAVAKELRRYTDRLSQLTAEMGDQPTEKWGDIDVEAATVYVKAASRLLSFYSVTLSQEQIELLPLEEVRRFLEKQLEVQGEEDFLLAPLRRTITNFSAKR